MNHSARALLSAVIVFAVQGAPTVADDAADSFHYLQSGDRFASDGHFQQAVQSYVIAIALEPESSAAAGRLLKLLVSRDGLDVDELASLDLLPNHQGGFLKEIPDIAAERIELATRILPVPGGANPLFFEKVRDQLPNSADLERVSRGQTDYIQSSTEAIPFIQAGVAFFMNPPVRRTDVSLAVFRDFRTLRTSLRLSTAILDLSEAVDEMATLLPVRSDVLSPRGMKIAVRAAALRQMLIHIENIYQAQSIVPADNVDVLDIEAARVFPHDRNKSRTLATERLEAEPTRTAFMTRAQATFSPQAPDDSSSAIHDLTKARTLQPVNSTLPIDAWLLGRYRGAAFASVGIKPSALRDLQQSSTRKPFDIDALQTLSRVSAPESDTDRVRFSEVAHQRRALLFILRRAWSRAEMHLDQSRQDSLTHVLRAILQAGREQSSEKLRMAEGKIAALGQGQPVRADCCRALLVAATKSTSEYRNSTIAALLKAAKQKGMNEESFERELFRQIQQLPDPPETITRSWLDIPD